MDYTKETEGRYRVSVNGRDVGHVTKTREAVRPTNGSRVRSGAMRTAWLAGTAGYGYATRAAAAEVLLSARIREDHDDALAEEGSRVIDSLFRTGGAR